MSLEETFDRVAFALERIADYLQPQVLTSANPINAVGALLAAGATNAGVVAAGATSTSQIPAANTAVAGEAPKKARGRPAKITTEEKATATTAVIVEEKPAAPVQPAGAQIVDDFLSPAPAAKPPTLEELRAALQAYAQKNDNPPGQGMAKARELLTKYGNGASRLAIARDVPGGDQGVIEVTYYQAVINAARA